MIPRPPRSTRTVPLFPDPTLSPALAAAAAAAESITAAAEAAILKATAEIVATAETVALVPAAPAAITAASFVETHALLVFPTSPKFTIKNPRVGRPTQVRSEEHTSELQSLMTISYAVFFLTKKITPNE